MTQNSGGWLVGRLTEVTKLVEIPVEESVPALDEVR